MRKTPSLTRRRFAAVLAGLSIATGAKAQSLDKGIGGTGAAPDPEEAPRDRGIGGTGVVGTIRRFGSIVVNGLRIAFAESIPVVIDGEHRSTNALRIGHVVRVKAVKRLGGFATKAIVVTSEVVGPVEDLLPDGFVVMGQRVLASPERVGAVAAGSFVAVSGLRRADATIVASLVEPRGRGLARVAGPVRRSDDGGLTVGTLRLANLDPSLAGRRCHIVGRYQDGALSVIEARDEQDLLLALSRESLLVEAYVALADGGVSLGSGLEVAAGATSEGDGENEFKAVLAIGVGSDGALAIHGIRPENRDGSGRKDGSSPSGPGGRKGSRRGGSGGPAGQGAPASPGARGTHGGGPAVGAPSHGDMGLGAGGAASSAAGSHHSPAGSGPTR